MGTYSNTMRSRSDSTLSMTSKRRIKLGCRKRFMVATSRSMLSKAVSTVSRRSSPCWNVFISFRMDF